VVGVFLFYFLCEVLPLSVILLFYRVESIADKYTEIPNEIEDDDVSVAGTMDTLPLPLAAPPRHGSRPTISPLRSVSRNNQPEIVDAIIARLSVETGGMGEIKPYEEATPRSDRADFTNHL
jgi:hypothetical protein